MKITKKKFEQIFSKFFFQGIHDLGILKSYHKKKNVVRKFFFGKNKFSKNLFFEFVFEFSMKIEKKI